MLPTAFADNETKLGMRATLVLDAVNPRVTSWTSLVAIPGNKGLKVKESIWATPEIELNEILTLIGFFCK